MNQALDSKVAELQQELENIEMDVLTQGYTLADAIREGCLTTQKAEGWNNQDYSNVCALTAAHLAAKARGIIK